jgi:hypothetical protein
VFTSVIALREGSDTVRDVPGPRMRSLTPAQARRLGAAEARIDKAEREWAELVRELGIAAVARHKGDITPQAMGLRVRKALRE